MRVKDALIGAAVVAILAIAGWVWLSPTGTQQAPDVPLLTLDGSHIRLSALRNRPVLVTFWATTCPTCVKEIPALTTLYRELSPHGLEIIGVAMYYDPPNQVAEMVKQRAIPYTVALDLDQNAMRAFGMREAITPTTFLIAPDGRIVFRKAGLLDMTKLERTIRDMLPAA